MNDNIGREERYCNGRFKCELTKEYFLRQTLITLSADEDTPADILSCEFDEIEDLETEVLVVKTHVDVDVTCQVGIDREEDYWDKQTYRENGVEKVRNVKRTRTVTDWKPFAFSRNEMSTAVVINTDDDESSDENDSKYYQLIKDSNKDNIEPLPESAMSYNDGAIVRAKKTCIKKTVEKAIPSKKYRDVSPSGNVTVQSINGIIVPQYLLKYKYKESEYCATVQACGEKNFTVDRPKDKLSPTNVAGNRTAPFFVCSLISLILAFIFIGDGLSMIICLIPLLLFLVFAGVGFFIFSRIYNKLKKNKQQEKLSSLISVLKNIGLEPLSADEQQEIINAKLPINK